jgi:ABC-type xylose transport system permease subunit
MNLIERAKAPTSKFFRTLRNVGLALAAAGAAILAAPIGLPAAIVTLGGYLTIGGAVLSAVSQITVDGESDSKATQSDGKSS